jgi:hypothetical protein
MTTFASSERFAAALGKHGFPFEEIPAGPAAPAALPGGGSRLHVFHVWPRNMAAAEQDRLCRLALPLCKSVFHMTSDESCRGHIVDNDSVTFVAALGAAGELRLCFMVAFQHWQSRRWGTVWYCSGGVAPPELQRAGLATMGMLAMFDHNGVPDYLVYRTSSTSALRATELVHRAAVAQHKGPTAATVLYPLQQPADLQNVASDAKAVALWMLSMSKDLRDSRDKFNPETSVFEGMWPAALRDAFAKGATSPIAVELNRRLDRERGDAQLCVSTWRKTPASKL